MVPAHWLDSGSSTAQHLNRLLPLCAPGCGRRGKERLCQLGTFTGEYSRYAGIHRIPIWRKCLSDLGLNMSGLRLTGRLNE